MDTRPTAGSISGVHIDQDQDNYMPRWLSNLPGPLFGASYIRGKKEPTVSCEALESERGIAGPRSAARRRRGPRWAARRISRVRSAVYRTIYRGLTVLFCLPQALSRRCGIPWLRAPVSRLFPCPAALTYPHASASASASASAPGLRPQYSSGGSSLRILS